MSILDEKVRALCDPLRWKKLRGNDAHQIAGSLFMLTDETTQFKIDEAERTLRYGYDSLLWHEAKTHNKFWFRKPQPRGFCWLDLLSGNGYRRQEALEKLEGPLPNVFITLVLFRRLNDWVEEVRNAARVNIGKIAKSTDSRFLADALFMALRDWLAWGRIDASGRKVLLDLLLIPEVYQLMKSKLVNSNSGSVAMVMAQIGRTSVLDKDYLKIATNAEQPAVRAKAYRFLMTAQAVWFETYRREWVSLSECKSIKVPQLGGREITVEHSLLELIEMAIHDKSVFVRRVGGEMLVRNSKSIGTQSRQLAEQLLKDKYPSVREQGSYILKNVAIN